MRKYFLSYKLEKTVLNLQRDKNKMNSVLVTILGSNKARLGM